MTNSGDVFVPTSVDQHQAVDPARSYVISVVDQGSLGGGRDLKMFL